jgi:hypothetical protein
MIRITIRYFGEVSGEEHLSDKEKIDAAMLRARDYAKSQYKMWWLI